jgi:hypothetical protein
MSKASLYVNSKGYGVTRHSYSGSESFRFCARKYYLERVQGWSEKVERAAKFFGIALEKAITCYHQNGLNVSVAVADFCRLWAEHKDKQYEYSSKDGNWETLALSGPELVRLYALRYPTFPYTVPNPQDAFQVETTFEVFPGTKLAGIEFMSYIDLMAQVKDTFSPIIIDMKTSGLDIPELIMLDPQLRSYSWVKQCPDVGFLWFRKCGRSLSKGDDVSLLETYDGIEAGAEAVVLAKDDFGIWVTPDRRVVDEIDAKFKGQSKPVVAARQAHIEANATHVPESIVTKQKVQFGHAVISPESAEDIGRSISRDIVNIHAATEENVFPMQSGVRWPNDRCCNCVMRGICSGNSELRDQLVTRKQVDEFDFGKGNE